jgi:hypothetical protein
MVGHLARIRELQNLGRAVKDALGVSLAEITFSSKAFDRIQGHGPDGTGIYAHRASNADFLLDFHHPLGVRTIEGPGGTYLQAGRFFAVQAGNRYVFPLAKEDDLNAGAPGVSHRVMVQGTNQLAHPTTAANVLGVLPVRKVTHPFSTHLILRTGNTAN